MATPLIATHRLELSYQIGTFVHKARKYVALATGGTPGSFFLTDRLLGSVPFYQAAQGFADTWGYLLAVSQAMSVDLQLFTTDGWVFMDGITRIPASVGGGSTVAAAQATAVLRDLDAHFIKAVFMEPNVPPPQHFDSEDTTQPNLNNWVQAHTGTISPVDPSVSSFPYHWEVSRGGSYIAVFGAVAGITTTFNRKIRRRRGLA